MRSRGLVWTANPPPGRGFRGTAAGPDASERAGGGGDGMAKRDGTAAAGAPPTTPDGRYFVVRGRLWRCSDPRLAPDERVRFVHDLMAARRAVAAAKRGHDPAAEAEARAAVDRAKRGLGERGPVWWDDGAPDLNRRMAHATPYAGWFIMLASEARSGGGAANESGAAAVPPRGPGAGPGE